MKKKVKKNSSSQLKPKGIMVLFAAIFIIILYGIYHAKSDPSSNALLPVLKVGKYTFTKEDVALAEIIEKQKYPYAKEELGSRVLKRAYAYKLLLEKLGTIVTDQILEGELKRIDSTSLNLEAWKKMKIVFQDHQQMLRVLILPIYVERVLPFDIFPRSPIVHKAKMDEANHLYEALKTNPAQWAELTKNKNLQTKKLCVWADPKTKLFKEGPECHIKDLQASQPGIGGVVDMSPQSAEGQMWKEKIKKAHGGEQHQQSIGEIWATQLAPQIKEGEVSPRLIETPMNYLIVRLDKKRMSKKGNKIELAEFSFIDIAKTNFDEWVLAESAKF